MKVEQLPKSEVFEPVPADDYKLVIEEIVKKTGDKGIYMNLKTKILEGEFKGRVIFDMVFFTPKSLWKLRNLLMGVGEGKLEIPSIECNSSQEVQSVDEEALFVHMADVLKNKELSASVIIEKSEGYDPKNRINKILDNTSERPNWDE